MAHSMRVDGRALRWLILPLLLLCVVAHGQSPRDTDLVTMLHSGGLVILMRHASSPATPPLAGQAEPGNSRLERQLDAPGRSAARAMGNALRQLKIPIGEVLCSPTYRARETLRLAGWPQPQIAAELGDGGHNMQADASGRRGAWLRSRVLAQPRVGTDALIVTQLPNIAEAFPQEAQGLGDGGALLLRADGHGGATLLARIPITEWTALAAAH
jgi:hypothetical protein